MYLLVYTVEMYNNENVIYKSFVKFFWLVDRVVDISLHTLNLILKSN